MGDGCGLLAGLRSLSVVWLRVLGLVAGLVIVPVVPVLVPGRAE